MKQAYLSHYKPLVQQFCTEMQQGSYEGLEHLPQPFLPLFGTGYEQSALRLLVVGQDAKGWRGHAPNGGRQMDKFIKTEIAHPGHALSDVFSVMENHEFQGLPRNTHGFFGFVMATLAQVHGIQDWTVLKWDDQKKDVLSSFAWANANAVEIERPTQVSPKTHEAARKASAPFNRLSHMLVTLAPDVVLITYKGLRGEFFDGLEVEEVPIDSTRFRHYRIESPKVDILHTRHMDDMRKRKQGGPWVFLNELRGILRDLGKAPVFPEFVAHEEESKEVLAYLMEAAGRPAGDKYAFIAWVAKELRKHGAFMSVPQLASLVNETGYRTSYGTKYLGKRGSYRLVRGAYRRHEGHAQDTAAAVAEAFRKPDFTYAYK